jgi:NAD(P)-dependent dehydrogenase (short-subunit alcohol dehydrogenase family)
MDHHHHHNHQNLSPKKPNPLPTPHPPSLMSQPAQIPEPDKMPDSFADKVVLITGAGSGIGRATALKLAGLKARLALTDINGPSLSSTLEACSKISMQEAAAAEAPDAAVEPPPSHFSSVFDIGSSAACNGFIAGTMKHYGTINHIFNCAGVNPTSYATADVTDEYWDRLMSTNLKGLFNMTRACIPHLQPGSSFVNVSSLAGTSPMAGFAVYSATKYGIIGFSKCLALELGPRGIRTNVVAPGFINTPSNASVVAGPDAVERNRLAVSLGRIGSVDEVADVVVFLMGHGARYINGAVIDVDGGVY